MPLGRLDDEQQKVALKEAETEAYATGMIETARKEVAFNEKRVAVTRALVEDGKASPRELERYVMELEIASAKLRAQEESKQISKVRKEKAALSLHDRTIRAPHDGIVDEIYRDEGEYIAGNSPSLVRLVDVSDYEPHSCCRKSWRRNSETAPKQRSVFQATQLSQVGSSIYLLLQAQKEEPLS